MMETGKTPKIIYLNSLHCFGKKQGLEIYNRIKPVLYQKAVQGNELNVHLMVEHPNNNINIFIPLLSGMSFLELWSKWERMWRIRGWESGWEFTCWFLVEAAFPARERSMNCAGITVI